MARTLKLDYISTDQIFEEVVEQLKKDGTYRPDLLYRCFRTRNIKTLRNKGNDMEGCMTPSEMRDGWAAYEHWKTDGLGEDYPEWETFDILAKYKLMLKDFIFASTEQRCRDWLKTNQRDCALIRLIENPWPTSISVWTPDNLEKLKHHAFKFKDKRTRAKKASLVRVFKVINPSKRERAA